MGALPRHRRAAPVLTAPFRQSGAFGAIALLAAATPACAPISAGGPRDFDPWPGVRTVEGEAPEGFPWRLRLPGDASPARPARLVVWLHPAGRSLNRRVESLAPELAARGFGLLVVTDKAFERWRGDELRRLLGPTLADAGRTPGADPRHPVLLGFSAGGQAALLAWRLAPAAFGGVAVTGAEPTAPGPAGPRDLDPPPAALRPAPLWVAVGAGEPAAAEWRSAAPRWREAGLEPDLVVVPGRGHEWLLEGEVRAAFLGWLARLPAPETRPTGP